MYFHHCSLLQVPEADWRLLTAVTSIVNESELSEALQMPLLQTLVGRGERRNNSINVYKVNLWRSPDTDELVKFALLDLVKGLLANYYSASTVRRLGPIVCIRGALSTQWGRS